MYFSLALSKLNSSQEIQPIFSQSFRGRKTKHPILMKKHKVRLATSANYVIVFQYFNFVIVNIIE